MADVQSSKVFSHVTPEATSSLEEPTRSSSHGRRSPRAVVEWMQNRSLSRLEKLSCREDTTSTIPQVEPTQSHLAPDEWVSSPIQSLNSPTSVASSYSYDSHGNISGISAHYTYLSPSSPLSKHVKFAQSGPRRRYTKDTSGYACDVAGCRSNSARYDTLSALKHHQRCHRPEEERRHECPYCKKRFEFPKDKKRHMKIHTGEKVECSICGHKSTRPDQLRVHQRRCHGTASSWGGSETGSSSAMTRGSAPSSFSYVTSDTSIESLLPDHTRNEGELVAFTSHCDDDDYAQLEHINGADSGDSRKQLALEAESCSCPPEQCHASACPLGVPLPPETVARLVAQFKALWRSAAKDAGSSGSSEPYPQAHADTPSQQRTSWGHRASLKRRRSTAGDGNGEEDGEERHPRRSGDEPSQESSFEEPKFACPIAIIFRSRFSNCNARGQCCWINGHTRFCDVTYHLYRYHQNPEGRIMGSPNTVITARQIQAAVRRMSTTDPDVKWRTLFRWLFTEAEVPVIPNPRLDANILQTMLDRTARIDALEDTIRDLQSQLAWHRQGAPAGGEPITSWSASAQMTPAPPAPPLWLLSTPGPSSGASSNPLWTPPSGSSPSFADSFTESSVHNGNIDSMAFQQPPPPSRSLPSANTSTPVLQGGFGFGTVQPYVQHQSQLFGTPTPPPQPPQPWMQWDPSVHPPDGSVALPPAYHMPSSPLPSGLPQTAMPLPDHHQYHATAPGMHAAATQSPGAAFWDQAPAQYANTAQLTQPTFQEFPPAMNVNLAAVPGGSGLSMDGQLQPDAPMLASRNLFDEFVEEHAWETDAEPSVPYQRRRGHEQGHGRHHHRSRGR